MSSPNERGETQPAGAGSDPAPSAPAPGSWVAEAAASATRSRESGETPPWQKAGTRNPAAQAPDRPTEVIRAVVTNRPADSAAQVTAARTDAPTPRPEARATVAPGVIPPSAPAAPPPPTVAGTPPAPGSTPTPVAPAPAPDPRTSRYVTGTAAPRALQQIKPAEPESVRTEVVRQKDPKAVLSELPDLTNAARPTQRSEADSSRIQVSSRAKGGAVRASMQIRRVDPWSTLKVSLLLSVSLFFVWMIAVAFLYLVLGGMGVWTKLNSNVGDLLTSNSGAGGELVSAGSIFGGALLIGLVNIVLLTAMATIGAFIYNLTTDIVGGVEVTLADRD